VHAGAVDAAAAGRLGHGMSLGDQQHGLKPAIDTRCVDGRERRSKTLAICIGEPHPRTSIMTPKHERLPSLTIVETVSRKKL
jgi:hypothetical protein